MFTGFKAIALGESHKEKALPCQDAVFFEQYRNGGIIAVADGHGSEKHFRSDAGSALAVDIAGNTLYEFAQLLKIKPQSAHKSRIIGERAARAVPNEARIKHLERAIITRWRDAVLEHYNANPLNDDELALCTKLGFDPADENTQARFYGTTLLAALIKEEYWFALKIGDGNVIIIDTQGKAYFPAIDDEALGFGKTTSLCDTNAAGNFREIYSDKPVRGITVATDGVTDSFIPEAYLEFHEKLYADFRRNAAAAREGVEKGIGKWAANGSRDDAAMAGIFRV